MKLVKKSKPEKQFMKQLQELFAHSYKRQLSENIKRGILAAKNRRLATQKVTHNG